MKDLGHYAPAFEPTVGAELAQFIDRSFSGNAATTMLYERRQRRDAVRADQKRKAEAA